MLGHPLRTALCWFASLFSVSWTSRVGHLHHSISECREINMDGASPFARALWIPAYAGMTVVVQTTRRGRMIAVLH